MRNFKIATHQKGRTYRKPHFFILNKGLNSGKPYTAPLTNCFVVLTEEETYKNQLYFLSKALIESHYYRVFLKGTAIPFVTIDDVRKLLFRAVACVNQQEIKKSIETLEKLEELEDV